MTAAVYRTGTPALSVPPTQNTAPVLEFNCLYTHDVRKKAKKWQDGFLRFHTFNKRIMVYDVPRNFVGDVHWKSSEPVQDGDEVWLDQDVVLVQVGENVGSTQTDLTDLRNAAKRSTREKGQISTPGPTPRRVASTTTAKSQPSRDHRPLNSLLGKSHNLMGRASLPTKSPYEIRHSPKENTHDDGERPAKRQRTEAAQGRSEQPHTAATRGSGWDVPQRERTGPSRPRPKDSENLNQADPQTAPKFMAGFSSDALEAPSSPKRRKSPPRPASRMSSPPAPQPQKTRQPRPSVQHQPAVSRTEKSIPQPPSESPVSSPFFSGRPRTKLQIATSGSRKRTLLCQNQLSAPPAKSKEPKLNANTPAPMAIDWNLGARAEERKARKAQREKLKAQLKRLGKEPDSEQSSPSNEPSRAASPGTMSNANDSTDTVACDQELARLDELLLPSLRPSTKLDSNPGRPAPKNTAGPDRELERDNRFHVDERRSKTLQSAEAPSPDVEQSSRQTSPQPQQPVQATRPPAPHSIETSPEKNEARPFRRVVSDPTKPPPKRIPGAPIRYKKTSPKPSFVSDNASDRDMSRPPSPQPTTLRNPSRSVQLNNTTLSGPTTVAASSNGPPQANSKSRPFNITGARKFQRSVSLNTATRGTAAVMLGRPFQKPGSATEQKQKSALPPAPPNPWSREAFDLFEWRPPDWDEEKWCVDEGEKDAKQGE